MLTPFSKTAKSFFSVCVALAAAVPFSSPLRAQAFAPVPSLSFTKPFGGLDPLPQIVSIAAVGAGFNFTTTSSSTGPQGSWLSTNPGAGCCETTPEVITATVTTLATLPVGSYSGQIVVTNQANTFSMTIPVTLNVVATSGIFPDNLPGAMSFAMKTGGTAIASQDIQIRNGGTGTGTWGLTLSTSDGGSWLHATASSGTAPATVTISVTPANLPGAGAVAQTFVGQLVFTEGTSTTTVPVSVVVGANILSQINPINFVKLFGGANPLPQVMMAPSTGTTGVSFLVTSSTATGGSWLGVTPGAGCCSTTPSTITATVNAIVTLPVGIYTAQIVVTTQGGGQAITIPVTLTVEAAGGAYFDNLPGQMSFSLLTANTAITSQVLEVRNAGSGSLPWTLTTSTSDAHPWLTASASSGSAPSIVTFGVNVANLPSGGLIAGTFIGEAVFDSATGRITVPISVTVGASIFNEVGAINFTKVFGGANPLPQNVAISSNGTTQIDYVVSSSTATGGSWLTVSPGVGCCSTTPNTVTATVNAVATLPVGTYTGQIVVTSQGGADTLDIPVTLTVAAAASTPYFDNVPGAMSFSLVTAAANNPPAQVVQIRNAGTGTLNWTLATSTSDGGNWLSVSAMSGTAPTLVSVSVQKANLPSGGLIAGTFVGELVFRTPSGSSVSVSVSVTVGPNVLSQVNAINFIKPFGGSDPLPQSIPIASTGTTGLNFITDASTATGGSWLTVTPGTGCCTVTPNTVVATVASSPTLAVGTYTAEIVVTTQGGGQAITIPVTLTVEPVAGAYFDNLPGGMSFFIQTSSGNPAAQNVQVRNAGTGTLNWTLSTSTSDGGNWLTVSASSGAAPSTITVGVVATALPNLGLIAGTFTGELVFDDGAGGRITMPVEVTVGTNIFVEAGSLSFTKAYGAANPLAQTVNIASGGTAINFLTASAAGTGGSWLTNNIGTGCCSVTPRVITATITASPTLAVGTYTGQIVTTSQSGAMAMTIPVYLTVSVTLTAPALVAPANAATGVSVTPTLSWGAVTGATSYDDYFRTSKTPPIDTNVTRTTYRPADLQKGTVYYWNIVARNGGVTATSSTFSFTTQFPSMSLSETTLNFGSGGGSVTDPQFSTVSFAGSARVAWTATSSQANVHVTPASGTGLGTLTITASAGPSAVVTVTAPGVANSPLTITVNVANVTPGNPFGSFDTPASGAAVSGSIAVTGWALDGIEVTGLNIMREPVAGEPASPPLILVGAATFVVGARPDVQALYPSTPFNYRAGWGYLLLTNELPNNGGAAGPGNGTYKLHAVATNKSGVSVDLGTKTITVNNAAATLPFGAIDTPGQGATVSGTVTNFGWALTPPTAGCPAADQPCIIPVNGSTIFVYVDGVSLGSPVYNLARCDVDQLFPGYANSGSTNCALNGTSPGPVGYFNLDTTTLANGVHTIAWSVTDNAGRAQGIGSRYFTVEN